MKHDEKILKYIAKDENVSQRQLAKYTDLSLGNLNLVLHRLATKGLITIEKINTRNLRYILTPQGIARNTKRTYNYIQSAVKLVLSINQELSLICRQYLSDGHTVYIDGSNDEIQKIIKHVLNEQKLSKVIWINCIDDIKDTHTKNGSSPLVILWEGEKEQAYKEQGIEYINLLSRIDN
ncbi:MAG: winged helix-turn-helix transcriptional regulator [Clostridia bacterium]|jgi:DNA-binding MarR family transcriptional regulator